MRDDEDPGATITHACDGTSEPADPRTSLMLTFPGEPMAVRRALRDIDSWLADDQRGREIRRSVEIVLAEALNNICEHAYSGANDGKVILLAEALSGALRFELRDSGKPMSEEEIFRGRCAPLPDPKDLPEGGFGWCLIRMLSREVQFRRVAGENRLSFVI